jgi:hypothetical protein
MTQSVGTIGPDNQIRSPRIFCIYWGQVFQNLPASVQKTNAYIRDLVVSRYMDGAGPYGVGFGKFTGHAIINDASISPVTADLARDCLKNWISQGKVPPPSTTQRDLLHVVFVPYGVNVKENFDDPDDADHQIGGFHKWSDVVPNLVYAVVRWAGDAPAQPDTGAVISPIILSHELIEAFTNPTGEGIHTDQKNAEGQNLELADVCFDPVLESALTVTVDGLPAQRYWSDLVKACFPLWDLYQPTIYFSIVNSKSHLALDLPLPDAGDGTQVQQYAAHGGQNQQWRLYPLAHSSYKIICRQNLKVLEVLHNSKEDHAPVVVRDYQYESNQCWRLLPSGDSYLVQSALSQKVLDVPDGSLDSAVKIQQFARYANPDHKNQLWEIKFASAIGYFKIRSRASGQFLTIFPDGTKDGVQLVQKPGATPTGFSTSVSNDDLQRWQLVPGPAGTAKIVFAKTGHLLEVRDASNNDQAWVQQFPDNNGSHQQWQLKPMPGGYFKIVCRKSQKNLDLAQNSGAIQQFHDNGGLANQLWDFVPVGPPAS